MTSALAILSMPGPMELVIIGIIALLLFGKRLPEVARNLGKGITEFKKGVRGIDEDDDQRRDDPPRSSSRPHSSDDRVEPTAPRFDPPGSPPTNA